MKIAIKKSEINAIREAVKETSQSDLSRKSGIAQNSISRYISGHHTLWSDSTLAKLYPYIKKYLTKEAINEYSIQNQSSLFSHHLIQGGSNNSLNSTKTDKSELIQKILNSKNLSDTEKIKMLKVINE